jgi:hypothetical protein
MQFNKLSALFSTSRFSAPEVLEPVRRKLDIANRVLDVLVAEPSL